MEKCKLYPKLRDSFWNFLLQNFMASQHLKNYPGPMELFASLMLFKSFQWRLVGSNMFQQQPPKSDGLTTPVLSEPPHSFTGENPAMKKAPLGSHGGVRIWHDQMEGEVRWWWTRGFQVNLCAGFKTKKNSGFQKRKLCCKWLKGEVWNKLRHFFVKKVFWVVQSYVLSR